MIVPCTYILLLWKKDIKDNKLGKEWFKKLEMMLKITELSI